MAYITRGLLIVVLIVSTGSSLTLEIISPLPGAEYRIGDTLTLEYTGDADYQNGGGSGTVTKISPDEGENFYLLCPLETPDFCPTVVGEESWGRSTFVIPDSLYSNLSLDSLGAPLGVSLVSDLVIMRIHDYVNGTVFDQMPGPMSILPRSSSVLQRPGRDRSAADAGGSEDEGCGAGVGLALLPLFIMRVSVSARNRSQRRRRSS